MPHRCALGCKNNNITMHSFPSVNKQYDRFKEWLELFEINSEAEYEYVQTRRICDIHFCDEHRTRFQRLSALAVPLLHLPGAPVSVADIMSKRRLTVGTSVQSEPASLFKQETEIVDDCLAPADDIQAIDDDILDTEPEPSQPAFSWQKISLITLDDQTEKENSSNVQAESADKDSVLISEVADEVTQDIITHSTEYTCNECNGNINGYTCVQCDDYDLCAACEQKLVHPLHYMLRVPGPRPRGEVKSILNAVRIKLEFLKSQVNNISHGDCDLVIKKEEDPFEEFSTVPVAHREDTTLDDIVHREVSNVTYRRDIGDEQIERHRDNTDTSDLEQLDNENQSETNEQDVNSELEDWLDESLLDLGDEIDSEINKPNQQTLHTTEESDENLISKESKLVDLEKKLRIDRSVITLDSEVIAEQNKRINVKPLPIKCKYKLQKNTPGSLKPTITTGDTLWLLNPNVKRSNEAAVKVIIEKTRQSIELNAKSKNDNEHAVPIANVRSRIVPLNTMGNTRLKYLYKETDLAPSATKIVTVPLKRKIIQNLDEDVIGNLKQSPGLNGNSASKIVKTTKGKSTAKHKSIVEANDSQQPATR